VDAKAFELLEKALKATSRLVVATGITNIWAWQPEALARRVFVLEDRYAGRFLLGLGVSHAPQVEKLGQHYERPLEAMSGFLGGLDEARGPTGRPRSGARPPRVLAALGDRMLALSRDRSEGAHPYLSTPAHSERARRVLGAAPLLAPEQAFVLEQDPSVARTTARRYLEHYLRLVNYRANLERLGYARDDLDGAGSDRLVDDVVAHGSAAVVAERVRAHLEAGADHVCVQSLADSAAVDLGALSLLAGSLRGL
jgi:probable F420-dependent oxidoreductase